MLAENLRSGNCRTGQPDDISAQAQLPDPGQWRDIPIDEWSDAEPAQRNQLPLLLADHLKIRQIHQIQKIGGGDVVDLGLPALAVAMPRPSFKIGSHKCE